MKYCCGVVILDWNDYAERDLVGYKIYRSTSENGPFVLIEDQIEAGYFEDNNVIQDYVLGTRLFSIQLSFNRSAYANRID